MHISACEVPVFRWGFETSNYASIADATQRNSDANRTKCNTCSTCSRHISGNTSENCIKKAAIALATRATWYWYWISWKNSCSRSSSNMLLAEIAAGNKENMLKRKTEQEQEQQQQLQRKQHKSNISNSYHQRMYYNSNSRPFWIKFKATTMSPTTATTTTTIFSSNNDQCNAAAAAATATAATCEFVMISFFCFSLIFACLFCVFRAFCYDAL